MLTPCARGVGLVGLLVLALQLGACCTSDKCLDSGSTEDKNRVSSPRVKLDVVYNDSVSAPKRDRTDWKYVTLARPGKLIAELHWDNGKAKLELEIFDVMGIKIQEGRVWGTGGLRAVAAVEDAGPYYVRVRASSKTDESQYSLRIMFQPERTEGGAGTCHNCKPADRKCLDTSAIFICEKIGPGCNAWTRIEPCPAGVLCRNGICDPCANPCPDKSQRCTSATHIETCELQAGATCPSWGPAQPCPAKHRCRDNECVRVGGPRPKVTPKVEPRPVPTPPVASNRARIISIYRYRGVWTLHIEIGDNPAVKAGQVGVVLDGETGKPLAGGEIRINKVAGRFAIATTSLQQLGKNRWVRIDTR